MGDHKAREAKDSLFDGLASVAKAVSSGRRAEILDVLAQGDRSVDDLSDEIGQSIANTSHHLQVLSRAGLVRTRREGKRIFYRLADERVGDLWSAITDIAAQHVPGIEGLADAYLGDRATIAQMTRGELARRLGETNLLVLDVRPRSEYDSAHISTAESVPIGILHERITEIPDDVEVVAYCRGPYCVYALDAVRMLTASGVSAQRLEGGLPEWRQAGLPVEGSSISRDIA